jgi:hypothetical protein
MKKLLLTNWTLWRATRLVVAIICIVAGALRYDTILILAGVFLLIHAVLNSCAACVGGYCETPAWKNSNDKGKIINHENI